MDACVLVPIIGCDPLMVVTAWLEIAATGLTTAGFVVVSLGGLLGYFGFFVSIRNDQRLNAFLDKQATEIEQTLSGDRQEIPEDES